MKTKQNIAHQHQKLQNQPQQQPQQQQTNAVVFNEWFRRKRRTKTPNGINSNTTIDNNLQTNSTHQTRKECNNTSAYSNGSDICRSYVITNIQPATTSSFVETASTSDPGNKNNRRPDAQQKSPHNQNNISFSTNQIWEWICGKPLVLLHHPSSTTTTSSSLLSTTVVPVVDCCPFDVVPKIIAYAGGPRLLLQRFNDQEQQLLRRKLLSTQRQDQHHHQQQQRQQKRVAQLQEEMDYMKRFMKQDSTWKAWCIEFQKFQKVPVVATSTAVNVDDNHNVNNERNKKLDDRQQQRLLLGLNDMNNNNNNRNQKNCSCSLSWKEYYFLNPIIPIDFDQIQDAILFAKQMMDLRSCYCHSRSSSCNHHHRLHILCHPGIYHVSNPITIPIHSMISCLSIETIQQQTFLKQSCELATTNNAHASTMAIIKMGFDEEKHPTNDSIHTCMGNYNVENDISNRKVRTTTIDAATRRTIVETMQQRPTTTTTITTINEPLFRVEENGSLSIKHCYLYHYSYGDDLWNGNCVIYVGQKDRNKNIHISSEQLTNKGVHVTVSVDNVTTRHNRKDSQYGIVSGTGHTFCSDSSIPHSSHAENDNDDLSTIVSMNTIVNLDTVVLQSYSGRGIVAIPYYYDNNNDSYHTSNQEDVFVNEQIIQMTNKFPTTIQMNIHNCWIRNCAATGLYIAGCRSDVLCNKDLSLFTNNTMHMMQCCVSNTDITENGIGCTIASSSSRRDGNTIKNGRLHYRSNQNITTSKSSSSNRIWAHNNHRTSSSSTTTTTGSQNLVQRGHSGIYIEHGSQILTLYNCNVSNNTGSGLCFVVGKTHTTTAVVDDETNDNNNQATTTHIALVNHFGHHCQQLYDNGAYEHNCMDQFDSPIIPFHATTTAIRNTSYNDNVVDEENDNNGTNNNNNNHSNDHIHYPKHNHNNNNIIQLFMKETTIVLNEQEQVQVMNECNDGGFLYSDSNTDHDSNQYSTTATATTINNNQSNQNNYYNNTNIKDAVLVPFSNNSNHNNDDDDNYYNYNNDGMMLFRRQLDRYNNNISLLGIPRPRSTKLMQYYLEQQSQQ